MREYLYSILFYLGFLSQRKHLLSLFVWFKSLYNLGYLASVTGVLLSWKVVALVNVKLWHFLNLGPSCKERYFSIFLVLSTLHEMEYIKTSTVLIFLHDLKPCFGWIGPP